MPQPNYAYPNLTISTRLRQLEYYLGYKVFVKLKGQNKIELTESVEVFLPLAKKYKKNNWCYERRNRHSVEIFDDVYADKIDIGISLKKFKYTGIETKHSILHIQIIWWK